MPKTNRVRELSTEAKIGKILILIGIIFGIVTILTIGSGMMGYWGMMNSGYGMMNWGGMMGSLFGGLFFVIVLIEIAGLIAGIYAYKAAERGDFHNAGILAIVSSVLPPFQLITLVGGIMCLVSKEGKK